MYMYFEALDLITNSITDWIDHPDFQTSTKFQELLLKDTKKEAYNNEYSFVCSFYGDDLNPSCLKIQTNYLEQISLTVKVAILLSKI